MGIFSKEYLLESKGPGMMQKFVLNQNIKDIRRRADKCIKSGDVEAMDALVSYIYKELYYKLPDGSKEKREVDAIIKELRESIKNTKSKLTSSDHSKIESTMKKIVAKYNNDDKIIDAIKKKTEYYEFVCQVQHKDDFEMTFDIVNSKQDDVNDVMKYVVSMAKDLRQSVNDKSLKIHTGDGDEGSIFVEKIK